MRKIIKFAVSYPVTVLMVVLAILLLGKISYDRLSVDLLPDLNNPRLFIELKAGELPPEEIEKRFIEPLEGQVIRQRDVALVSSVTRAGSSRVTVEYAWKKDMDEAFLDLQKAVNAFGKPDGVTEIQITQHDANMAPVVLIGLSHDDITDMATLRVVAESYIRNELLRLEGVADVTLSGDEQATLTVHTDPYKLKAFNLTVNDIAAKITDNSRDISGGRVSELGLQYIVKGKSTLTSEDHFRSLIVGYKPIEAVAAGQDADAVGKAPIFLRDVATVTFQNARPENIVRINGTRSIGLSVYKEMRYNTVSVVDAVTDELARIERALPGYQLQVVTNQGTFIKSAIGEVKDTAVLGVILAVLVLFVFLRRLGVTLIVSMAIPISIIATFNLMYFNGLTLNIMTLGGLALGAGMLIDNAIVVIESIFQKKEQGLSVRESAIVGTSEVAGAVTASTLTTIVVFLPIVYLHGATGEMFKDQAWTVTFSLVSSLFVAILVIPMLYDRLFGGKRAPKPVKSVQILGYGRFLRKVIDARWLVIGISVLLVAFAGFLVPHLGTEFMPRTEGRAFNISVKMPEGTRLERTSAAVDNLENLLYAITGDTTLIVYSHVGSGSGSQNSVFEGENTALVRVVLPDSNKQEPEEIVAHLIDETAGTEGLEIAIQQDDHSMGALIGGGEAPIVVEIKGEELAELSTLAAEVKERMLAIPGLYNVISSVEDGAPEITISINRTLAGMNNISVATIVDQIKQQLDGKNAGQMDYRGEMRDIVIKVPEITLSSLGDLTIKGGDKEFLLRELATIEPSVAPREIFRRNQSRISKVLAGIGDDQSLDKMAASVRETVRGVELPPNYTITVGGEEEQRQESMRSLMFALLLSIVLVYMVLASQFESLLHPFTILLTIPLAVVGAVLLFWITGMTINIMGVIGMVMLVGIAVNNSIILVDRISQIKQSGVDLREAIVQAGQQRIRPIIITSLTTILALLPLSLSIGEGAALRAPMAIAVIGGLLTSTVMSLLVIPCVYYLFERLKMRVLHRDQPADN